jgi:hypothetical protein
MRQGDLVLCAPKATGRFTYRATVAGNLESRELTQLLWPVDPAHPWSLIYLLEDVQPISLSKERLVAEFAYDRLFTLILPPIEPDVANQPLPVAKRP